MKTVANRMSHLLVMVGLLGMSSVSLAAQEYENTRWTANFGGGFTVPAYNTGTRHDNGWNFNAGGGANFLSSHVGSMGEFMYNSWASIPQRCALLPDVHANSDRICTGYVWDPMVTRLVSIQRHRASPALSA
jgi:hypothetical protein